MLALGRGYESASLLRELTTPSRGTDEVAAATLPWPDACKTKSEPWETSLSVNAGAGKKPEGPQSPAGTAVLQRGLSPPTGQTVSVTTPVTRPLTCTEWGRGGRGASPSGPDMREAFLGTMFTP